MTPCSARPSIGLDLTRARPEAPWPAVVREAAQLAPDLSLQLFVLPGQEEGFHAALPNLAVHAVAAPLPGLPAAWPRARRLQHRFHLDLLHLDGVTPGWAAGPWVGSLQHLPAARVLRRFATARLLCVPSQWLQDRLVAVHGFDPARILVLPPAVDAVRFRPGPDGQALVRALGLAPGGYLCCVARRDRRKLPLTLLEAYARMPLRPPLVLVGRNDDVAHRRVLEATIQRLGLQADVRLLDSVTDTQLPALLRHARLFVQPSLVAHRGASVLEAMASGVAVVTSDLPVLAERVGAAGVRVNPHDVHELAAAILCLLADPRRRQALVQRGLDRAAAHHWRGTAERLVHGWRQAVALPPPAPARRSLAWA